MFKNKTVVVTGAGRGIGKAIAMKFGELGANVVVNYRSSQVQADEIVDKILAAGGNAFAVKADVSSFDEAKNLITEAKLKFGTVDILVNNAGITKDTLLLRMKEDDFDSVIQTNLKGAFNCLKHAAEVMIKQRSGKIINISSVVGLMGNAGQINYSAAKAGIIGMTKSAAKELSGRGITVNAIAPGFITTEMTESIPENIKKDMLAAIPLKRYGTPENIADAVCFLASESASYITGQVLCVDGGMAM